VKGWQYDPTEMNRDFFDPTLETTEIVLIAAATLRRLEKLSNRVSIAIRRRRDSFDNVLDRVTGSNPSVTDYVLEVPAKCPNCKREILEISPQIRSTEHCTNRANSTFDRRPPPTT
jgi:hypothetical protein